MATHTVITDQLQTIILHGMTSAEARREMIEAWPEGCLSCELYSDGDYIGSIISDEGRYIYRTVPHAYVIKKDGSIRRRM